MPKWKRPITRGERLRAAKAYLLWGMDGRAGELKELAKKLR